jgi:hypothetical protein
MQDEHSTGDGSQHSRDHEGFQAYQASTSNSINHHPHLSQTRPHIGLPQTFIPYSPFLNETSPSALPTPPLPPSTGNTNNGYAFSPAPHNELSPLMTNMFGAALTSPPLGSAATPAAHGQLDQGEGGGGGPSAANQNKIVQKADRSCKKCRERRVRCDRQYPACARCTKRREQCSYGTGVFV